MNSLAIFDFEVSNLQANHGRMLVASVKKADGAHRVFRADDYQKSWQNDASDDRLLVIDIRDELEKYAWIAGHFSVFFDLRFLNTRLVHHRERMMSPLPRGNHLDTWLMAKKHLALSSNALASLGTHLGIEDKKTPITQELWMQAMRNDARGKDALDFIEEHCRLDVQITEQIVAQFLPLTKGW
jgi:hypothetical protein